MINKLILKCNDLAFQFDHVTVMVTYLIRQSNSSNKRVTDNYFPTSTGEVTIHWNTNPVAEGDISIIVLSAGQNVLIQRNITLAEANEQNTLTLKIDSGSFELAFAADVNVTPAKPFIYGRLLEANGSNKMEDVQLVFEMKTEEEAEFEAFATCRTESNGYFFIDNPKKSFAAVRVRVGLKLETNPIMVKLVNDDGISGSLPSRIILVAEMKEAESELDSDSNDCGCDGLEMHGARKVVEEFSYFSVVRTTEPEILGYVLEDDDDILLEDLLNKHPVKKGALRAAVADVFIKNKGNAGVVAAAPTDSASSSADRSASRARLTNTEDADVKDDIKKAKISSKVLKEFLSKEKELNQSNIEKLLQLNEASRFRKSLDAKPHAALARTVADSSHLIQWDGNATIYQAVSVAHGHLLHYKSEWISDGYSLGDLIYSLPLAPGQKKQIATLGWKRRESAKNSQQLDAVDRVEASIEHDRDIFEITKGAFSESLSGNSSATTASASASAGGVLGGVLFGVSGGVGHSSSRSNQEGMRNTSASDLQKIQDRVSQSASSVRSQRSTVIQTVAQGEELTVETESVANYNHCHAITIQYFEVLRHFKVRHRLADARECVFVPLLMSQFDLDKALNWRETLARHIKRPKLLKAFEAARRVRNEWAGSNIPNTTFAAERITTANGNMRISFIIRRPLDDIADVDDLSRPIVSGNVIVGYHKIKKDVINVANWETFRPFLGSETPESFYTQYLDGKKHKDAIFHQMLGDTIAREFVNSLRFSVSNSLGAVISSMNIDASLTSRYARDGVLNVRLRFNGPSSFPRSEMIFLNVNTSAASVPANSTIIIKDASMRYRTEHFEGSLFKFQSLNDDLSASDGVVIYTGPSQEELKNPRQEDVDLTNALIEHLNDHLEYYHKWIWLNLSPERRFMILDGIILNNPKAEGKSLASLVVNEVIGIVGNSMVFPVSPGLNIDPRFSLTDSLLEYYMVSGSEPSTVSVPTEGVFAEAMMGSCNSCEKMDDSRFWRWEESPIPDSPTAIGEVSTDSRRADPGNLTANPFANPIVNIQNAPAVSDPSGVGGTLSLLGKSDSFRDVTGLAGNQQNALSALQASYQATQSISQAAASLETKRMEEATKIEQAKIMERRLDKAIGTINSSKTLTPEQKQQLVGQAISGYLGGGSSPQTPAKATVDGKIQEAQKVTEALDKLVGSGSLSADMANPIKTATWKSVFGATGSENSKGVSNAFSEMITELPKIQGNSAISMNRDGETFSISTDNKNSNGGPVLDDVKPKPEVVPDLVPGKSPTTNKGGYKIHISGEAGNDVRLEHTIDPAIHPQNLNKISAQNPLYNPSYLRGMNWTSFSQKMTSTFGLTTLDDVGIAVYDLSSPTPLEVYLNNENSEYMPRYMANIMGMVSLQQLVWDVEDNWRQLGGVQNYNDSIDGFARYLVFLGLPLDQQPLYEEIFEGRVSMGAFVVRPEIYDSWRNISDNDYLGILSSTLMGYQYTSSVIRSYDLIELFLLSNGKRYPYNTYAQGIWQAELLPGSVNHLGRDISIDPWSKYNLLEKILNGGNGFVSAKSLAHMMLNFIQGRFVEKVWCQSMYSKLNLNEGGKLNPAMEISNAVLSAANIHALTDTTNGSHDVIHFEDPTTGKNFLAVILLPPGKTNMANSIFQTILANI